MREREGVGGSGRCLEAHRPRPERGGEGGGGNLEYHRALWSYVVSISDCVGSSNDHTIFRERGRTHAFVGGYQGDLINR